MMTDFEKLNAFAVSVLKPCTFDEFLWGITEQISALMGLDDCVIYLESEGLLIQTATFGIKNSNVRTIADPIRIPFGEGIVGTVAETGRAEIVSDTRLDSRYISDQFDGASELTVPIIFEDTVIGVIDSEANTTHAYTQAQLILLQAFANVAASRIAVMRAQLQQENQESKQDSDNLKSLGKLAGGVAHDFNNLLTIISLHIGSAHDGETQDEKDEAVEVILQAMERANGLTNQLMVFARGGEPQKEELDIVSIIKQSISFMSAWQNLVISLDVTPELPCVWADPNQLSQIFNNLLLNAAQAMKYTGVITISVYLQDGANGRHLYVSIQDQGPGISDSLKKKIFDPYFSTKEMGTGLGLATSHWIALRHDGALNVHDAEGGGARFTLNLPALHVKVVRSKPYLEVELPKLNVLILDDEPAVALGLQRLLVREGHEVEIVHHGEHVARLWTDALESDSPFDLAILDLVQPKGIGGLEAFKELKRIDPGVSAIVMSGYSDDPILADYIKHGFVARLAKPFRKKQLHHALQEALQVDESDVSHEV